MFDKGQKHELQLERIVFFSDAVFAIAITLLIIEVKVPHLEHEAGNIEFLKAVAKIIPNLVGYFFSFLVIGAYWVGHHRIYGMITEWDYGLVWRNILFLMAIAFMPFATAMFSEYVTSLVPLALYAMTFAAAGLLEILQFRYAYKRKLIDPNVSDEDIRHITWRMSVLPVVALVAVAIAFVVQPMFASIAFMLIPIAHRVIQSKFSKKETQNDGIEE